MGLPNVAMSRGYGWRGGCPAADVPDVGAGSVEWFGSLFFDDKPFCWSLCKIRMKRIHDHFSKWWSDDQVHVFHWDCSKQDFVPENNRANIALPILKSNPNRPNVGT